MCYIITIRKYINKKKAMIVERRNLSLAMWTSVLSERICRIKWFLHRNDVSVRGLAMTMLHIIVTPDTPKRIRAPMWYSDPPNNWFYWTLINLNFLLKIFKKHTIVLTYAGKYPIVKLRIYFRKNSSLNIMHFLKNKLITMIFLTFVLVSPVSDGLLPIYY